ncbi:MAG: hypothetical protein KAR33_05580 [Candidatus Thorarchaeota archaeon]|nr:hypothetical protein [Candidatus Thorarchaeota archaeon]
MQRSDMKNLLEVIGVSLMARDIQILGALLKLHVAQSEGHTVEDIRQKVNSEADKKFSKTWIYKCLSNLEAGGFIIVNRIDTPNTYSAGLESIGTALQNHIDKGLVEIEVVEKEIEEDIQFLNLQNADTLAENLFESITGQDVEKTSRVVEGLQNVRNLIISELTEGVGEGDILRVNERGELIGLEGMQSDAVESSILKAIENGLEVRAIFREVPFGKGSEKGTLKAYLQKEGTSLIKGVMSGKLKVRVIKDATLSYRMMSLNGEKMLLFLTDASLPDSVAFVTRDANPKLIDDAIDAFDKAWANSEDITAGFGAMFKQLGETGK